MCGYNEKNMEFPHIRNMFSQLRILIIIKAEQSNYSIKDKAFKGPFVSSCVDSLF